MKKIGSYIKNKYSNIPINDFEAYQHHYDFNDIYNKLFISQIQKLDSAPVGIIPVEFPVIIKPIINLYGMSNGFKKINNMEEFENEENYGMFWQKYLEGIQYNVDLNIIDGKVIQYFCVIQVPDLDGKFKYHYYKKDYILHKKIIKLIENLLVDYTGFLNIEVIEDFIIEMHLRLNCDLFLYTKKI